jgi:hypothetical protein
MRTARLQRPVKSAVNAAFRRLAQILLSWHLVVCITKDAGCTGASAVQKPDCLPAKKPMGSPIMAMLAVAAPVLVAAAGYSLLYLLMGGGLGGAILIFIVAKMLGK